MGKKRKSRRNRATSPPREGEGQRLPTQGPGRLSSALRDQIALYQERHRQGGRRKQGASPAPKSAAGTHEGTRTAPEGTPPAEPAPQSRGAHPRDVVAPTRNETHGSSPGDAKGSVPGAENAPVLSDSDQALLERALSGVTPLDPRKRARVAQVAPTRNAGIDPQRAEFAARLRLGALVAGDVHFRIERSPDGEVHGWRSDLKPEVLDRLYHRRWQPQARIDLHGQRGDEAAVSLARFVRTHQTRGHRRLLIVHGKGRHSEGGVGVLDEVVIQALTEGGAAPLIQAFGTARRELGGRGALMVQLRDR